MTVGQPGETGVSAFSKRVPVSHSTRDSHSSAALPLWGLFCDLPLTNRRRLSDTVTSYGKRAWRCPPGLLGTWGLVRSPSPTGHVQATRRTAPPHSSQQSAPTGSLRHAPQPGLPVTAAPGPHKRPVPAAQQAHCPWTQGGSPQSPPSTAAPALTHRPWAMPAVWAPWTHRPTCRKDLGCHSQEGVGHHGLGLQGDVQLAGHVAVDAGPDQLQLIRCVVTQAGQRWSHGPEASPLLSLWPQLGTLIPALLLTPRPVTFPPTRHHPQSPRGQDQGGAVGSPRPASGACPLCRASHAPLPPGQSRLGQWGGNPSRA